MGRITNWWRENTVTKRQRKNMLKAIGYTIYFWIPLAIYAITVALAVIVLLITMIIKYTVISLAIATALLIVVVVIMSIVRWVKEGK